ncbi:MAG: hypothetical protein QM500_09575 [Methylococcales bacterium]
MTKTKLISSFGGAVAMSLLAAPIAQASENPFEMQKVTNATQLAEGMMKGGEGKCGDKMKEGACNGKMGKMQEGKCSEGKCGDKMKMKEGTCSGKMEKMQEGKCSEGKCGDKMTAPQT